MAGLSTYRESERQTSALCGYGVRQAGVQGFLTDAQVVAATTAEGLIANVEAAVVAAGAGGDSQRQSIVRCLREGKSLGDFSDARVAAATSVENLVQQTWASEDAATGHLGTNLVP